MKRSEIFDSFVEIMQQKGKVAQAAEHTEKNLDNPRWDSLSIDQINKLYNTKTPKPKDMEYEKNIIEDAHPDPVVISPSYDRLNGLVENENERQNISLRIVEKVPDGQLLQRRYANELILSLVRVANQLDNQDKDELRVLADTCLLQLSKKKIHKQGQAVIAGTVAAILGALYAKQHLRFHSDGFEADYQKAISEIDDLLTSNANYGVGYAYTPQFIQTVNQLKTVLADLNAEVQKILPILDQLQQPHTANDLIQMAKQPETQEIVTALAQFKAEVAKVYPFIQKIILDFSDEGYKQRSIAQKGFFSSLVDSSEILHGGSGLIADDFDDVKHALQTLMVDLQNLVKGLQSADSVKQSVIKDLQSSYSGVTEMFAPQSAPASQTSTTTTTTEAPEGPPTDEELLGGIFGT